MTFMELQNQIVQTRKARKGVKNREDYFLDDDKEEFWTSVYKRALYIANDVVKHYEKKGEYDRSEKFNYDTILFEKDKYDNLIKSIDKEQADGAYYVSFWDDVAYIYLISREMNLKPYRINANKCTAINDDKKEKWVYFINKNDVKKYTI